MIIERNPTRKLLLISGIVFFVAVATTMAGPFSQGFPKNLAKHVLIIGVDGMKGEAVINAKAPHMQHLMSLGSYTLHARAVIPTVSKPNWASIIMGAPPELHGVTSNEWMPNNFGIAPFCKDAAGIFPTIFGVLRSERPGSEIGVFTDWDGFATLVEPKAPNVMDVTKEDQAKTTEQVEAFIRKRKPTLTFVHYDSVDEAGHRYGWDTPQYYAAVAQVDTYLGEILKALDESGLRDRTIVLVTADHGGLGLRHGQNLMADIEIPWIICGPGVRRDFEIKSPVITYDTAATVADILGLTPPSCWLGRPVVAAFRSH